MYMLEFPVPLIIENKGKYTDQYAYSHGILHDPKIPQFLSILHATQPKLFNIKQQLPK